MGFTPLEGLVMATRPGNADPGLLVSLSQDGRLTWTSFPAAGAAVRADRAGRLADVHVLPRATGRRRTVLAIDVYLHRLRQLIAGMAAAMTASTCWCSPAASASATADPVPGGLPGFLAPHRQRSTGGLERRRHRRAERAVRTLVITAREDIEIARRSAPSSASSEPIARR